MSPERAVAFLATWDPRNQELPDWIADQLDEDPAVRAAFDARFTPWEAGDLGGASPDALGVPRRRRWRPLPILATVTGAAAGLLVTVSLATSTPEPPGRPAPLPAPPRAAAEVPPSAFSLVRLPKAKRRTPNEPPASAPVPEPVSRGCAPGRDWTGRRYRRPPYPSRSPLEVTASLVDRDGEPFVVAQGRVPDDAPVDERPVDVVVLYDATLGWSDSLHDAVRHLVEPGNADGWLLVVAYAESPRVVLAMEAAQPGGVPDFRPLIPSGTRADVHLGARVALEQLERRAGHQAELIWIGGTPTAGLTAPEAVVDALRGPVDRGLTVTILDPGPGSAYARAIADATRAELRRGIEPDALAGALLTAAHLHHEIAVDRATWSWESGPEGRPAWPDEGWVGRRRPGETFASALRLTDEFSLEALGSVTLCFWLADGSWGEVVAPVGDAPELRHVLDDLP